MIRKEAFLTLIFILCLAILSGCATNNTTSGNSPGSDRYVAVEEIQKTSCTLINGSYNMFPHITPSGVFNYDGSDSGSNWADGSGWSNSANRLNGNYYPAVNGSLKVLAGTYYYRDLSPGDTRTGMRIRGVYSLPYSLDSGFVLQDIDRNGTIYGSYDNKSIVLRSGEQRTSPVFNEIKSGSGTGMDGQPFSYWASFNTTWTIADLGVFDKSNLTKYNNSVTAAGYSEGF